MGTFSILAKLTVVLFVLAASYLFVGYIVVFAQAIPSSVGFVSVPQGQIVSYTEDTLTLFAAAAVGVFFTMPLLLATSGHAGAWFKHVVSRSAKQLSVGLIGAFAVYVAASATSDISLSVSGLGQGLRRV